MNKKRRQSIAYRTKLIQEWTKMVKAGYKFYVQRMDQYYDRLKAMVPDRANNPTADQAYREIEEERKRELLSFESFKRGSANCHSAFLH